MSGSKYLHYLEEMEHYDKDNRYMGASDLCNLICSESSTFDVEKERKCISAFIKQLDDKSAEVQGKAVQCLAKIASKIREDNLGNILKKVADCIVNGDKDFRDIYSICCKSIMAEITDTYAPTVIKSCYPILQTGIKSSDEEVQEECIELLSEMLKRFASNIIHDPSLIKETAVLDQLFTIISSSAPYTLKKKVAYCMGCLGAILSSSNISTLMETIIKFINANMDNEGDLFYYILALSWVSRKIGYKLGSYLESLIANLINICDTLDPENSSDQRNEIAEEALNCLESLIKHCPREITRYIEKLLEVAQDRMTYDPIYDYEGDEDMEVDDEGEGWDEEIDDEDAQDDDSSWKVRRGSINLIISVITTRPEMLRTLYANLSSRLVNRFKERENKIKTLVFNAFSVLLKTTNVQSFDNESLTDRSVSITGMMKQRSSTEELFSQVPSIVKSLLKETSTKNVNVKIAILECLAEITKALRDHLNPFFVEILPLIKESVIGEHNTAVSVPALSSLKTMLQYAKDNEEYKKNSEEILDIILASLKSDHFSVKSEGLLATSSFTKILSVSGMDNDSVGKLNEVVLSCMDASENAIIAVSHLLSSCHNSLSKSEIDTNIDILIEKLKNDMKRIASLRAINRICKSSCGLTNYCENIVVSVTPLLSKSDTAVKINSLEVLNNFVEKYGNELKPNLNKVLSTTLTIITSENLQVADWALDLLTRLTKFKIDGDLIDQSIEKVTSLTESSFLSDRTITKILEFFRNLSKNQPGVDFESHIKFLESKVSINCTVPARCIAEILSQHPEVESAFITKYLKGLDKDDEGVVVVSSLILGEIGRLNDLSKNKDLTSTIDNLFNHQSPDVKIAASHCLGHICIGNLAHFLPIVIEFINRNPKHKYLLLMSIREIIDTKLSDITDHYSEISSILFENAKSTEEKIRNVVSECLGKLFATSGLEMLQEFDSRLSSTNQLVRATIARCFKYAATRDADPTAVSTLLPDIIELASDSEHQIRQFAIESLISISHNIPDLIKNEIDTLLKIISSEVEVKKELIKEVDLGPFKHKIDEGRPIRKAGFVLLDTVFEKMPERTNVPATLDIILVGLSDPDDDCVSQTLHILIKLIRWAPGAVAGQMSNILDKLPAILKEPAKGTTKSSIRIAVKAIENLNQIPDMETNTTFQKFIQDNNIHFEA